MNLIENRCICRTGITVDFNCQIVLWATIEHDTKFHASELGLLNVDMFIKLHFQPEVCATQNMFKL